MDFDKLEQFLKETCGDVNYVFVGTDKDATGGQEVKVLELANKVNDSAVFGTLISGFLNVFYRQGLSYSTIIRLVATSFKAFLMMKEGTEEHRLEDVALVDEFSLENDKNNSWYLNLQGNYEGDRFIKVSSRGEASYLLYAVCKYIQLICERDGLDLDTVLSGVKKICEKRNDDIVIDLGGAE